MEGVKTLEPSAICCCAAEPSALVPASLAGFEAVGSIVQSVALVLHRGATHAPLKATRVSSKAKME